MQQIKWTVRTALKAARALVEPLAFAIRELEELEGRLR